ncbi:C-type lectin domain family 2 member B-like isoform X1 [Notamacropus eugenii]|uniref:C-type lectin domain family 2 member B-like isoform X1 n=1 Tax=Notamacropus eugenii TaxID=9315 RepID=UPI003B68121C
MEKKKAKGANTRVGNKAGDNKKEKDLEEDEDEDEGEDKENLNKEEEKEVPQTLGRPGWIPKKLLYSTVGGGSFILILVIAVSISKHVGKSTNVVSEDKLCMDHSPRCPEDWFRAFRKCYYLSTDQNSWNASQKTCRSLGANLAIFTTAEEMEFLRKRIGSPTYWVGLINDKGTSSWTWVDGTSPSSWLQIEGAGCARLSQGGISSDSCMSSRNYICNKEDKCG